jgi:hypothetical protein
MVIQLVITYQARDLSTDETHSMEPYLLTSTHAAPSFIADIKDYLNENQEQNHSSSSIYLY